MSLRGDFRNYFCGTYIGVRRNGMILPFKVDDVVDRSDFSEADYSDAHRNALRFVGYLYTSETERSQFTAGVADETLILESPDIGYYLDTRGKVRWIRYRTHRGRQKGVYQQKLVGLNTGITGKLMYRLFNPQFDGLVNRHLYICPRDSVVYYKGVAIGKMIDGRVHLLRRWQHINGMLRDYQITVVDSVELPEVAQRRPFLAEEPPREEPRRVWQRRDAQPSQTGSDTQETSQQQEPDTRRENTNGDRLPREPMVSNAEYARLIGQDEAIVSMARTFLSLAIRTATPGEFERGVADNSPRPVPRYGETFNRYCERINTWING